MFPVGRARVVGQPDVISAEGVVTWNALQIEYNGVGYCHLRSIGPDMGKSLSLPRKEETRTTSLRDGACGREAAVQSIGLVPRRWESWWDSDVRKGDNDEESISGTVCVASGGGDWLRLQAGRNEGAGW
jgi:hypothetical protein